MSRRGCAIVLTVFVLSTGCGGGSGRQLTSPSVSPSVTASSRAPMPSYVVARVSLGKQPCAVVAGFGSLWVSLLGEDTVLRLDPRTRRVLARVKSGNQPCGMAVGAGSVWVEDYGDGTVTRIDARSNAVVSKPEAGSQPYDVTFGFGAAWVTNYGDNTVSRIDAVSGAVRAIRVGQLPTGVAQAGGAVWVTNKGDGTVSRIDPVTLKVRTVPVGGQPTWVAYSGPNGAAWWAADGGTNDVVAIDGRTGRVLRRLPAKSVPNDGDVLAGVLWVPVVGGQVYGWSAATGRPVGRGSWALPDVGNPFVLAAGFGRLWVVDFKGLDLLELDPAALARA
jgi:YVTN family beta-propeller protein